MRKTAIFKNDLFLQHIPDFNHVESPDRLRVIYDELEKPPLSELFIYPDFGPASQDVLALNHTSDHAMRIAGTAGKTFSSLDPDTQASPKSYDAACLAAGAVIDGASFGGGTISLMNGDASADGILGPNVQSQFGGSFYGYDDALQIPDELGGMLLKAGDDGFVALYFAAD